MGRKKEKMLDVLPMQPGFDGFLRQDVEDLENVLGRDDQ